MSVAFRRRFRRCKKSEVLSNSRVEGFPTSTEALLNGRNLSAERNST